jgi:hypothetical protein
VYRIFWLENLNVDTTWKIIAVGERIILKWILKILAWCALDLYGSGWMNGRLIQHGSDP